MWAVCARCGALLSTDTAGPVPALQRHWGSAHGGVPVSRVMTPPREPDPVEMVEIGCDGCGRWFEATMLAARQRVIDRRHRAACSRACLVVLRNRPASASAGPVVTEVAS
jgi:hypothetical protein